MTRLHTFADDSITRRNVGTPGHPRAAAYTEREVRKLGLNPGANSTGDEALSKPRALHRVSESARYEAAESLLTANDTRLRLSPPKPSAQLHERNLEDPCL